MEIFKLEQALTELALFQKTPRYQAYAQRVEEIKNRKETALRALEEKGVVRIGQEIRILASPAISMEDVQNIRVDKAAYFIYQAVIPVILNNEVEYLEEDESYVVKVLGQEVDHDMRVN